jgi:DNA helicase-2/ATP-dependent DNA helicase PcrA
MKDVLCYMRIIHNPNDELAWLRVLKMLPRVGTALSARTWQHISQADNPLERASDPAIADLFPSGARDYYRDFTRLMHDLRQVNTPAEMIDKIVSSGYEDYLLSRYDGFDLRREDIKGLANFAAQYDTLEAFLADVALAGELSGETVVTGPDEQQFVTLSTIHQAKGLEWAVVFIPWLADGRFPTDFAINTQEDLEEERRVLHVAVTRAKDEIYLIAPQFYRSRSKSLVMMKTSRFLMELSDGLTEPMELEEGLPHLLRGAKPEALPEAGFRPS